MVKMVSPGLKALRGLAGSTDSPAVPGSPAPQDRRVQLALPGTMASRVSLEARAQLDLRDKRGLQASPDRLAPMVRRGSRVPRGPLDSKGPQGHLEIKDLRALRGPMGPQGLTGSQGRRGQRGTRAPWEPQGCRGFRGIQARSDRQGAKGRQGPRGTRGPLETPGSKGPQVCDERKNFMSIICLVAFT